MWFILGLFVGGTVGFVGAALVATARISDDLDELERLREERRVRDRWLG